MKIFSVKTDIDKYQTILPVSDSADSYAMLDFKGLPKKETWQTIKFYIDNPLDKQGDFFSFINTSAFACNAKAVNKLIRFWDMCSELLPIYLENGTELFVINVVDCVNALNQSNSVYDFYEDGTKSNRILKYSFYSNRFHESSVFKIPETANIEVLTYTGVKSPEDEFYTAYKESGLEGLIFEELYSDD